jgi:hypothetical protein
MMTNLPKVRFSRDLPQVDPWDKLCAKSGVRIRSEAEA